MNDIQNIKVSVCVTTYNGEKYIKEQISSILNQIELDDEIIVSDDGSTDNTLGIIESFNDKRITITKSHIARSTKKTGYEDKLFRIFENFRNSFRHSSGEYIFLSDQDDVWFPGKYSIIKKHLIKNHLVVHDAILLSDNKSINGKRFFKLTNLKEFNYANTLFSNPYLGCCMAFRRSVGEIAFHESFRVIPHDTWITLVSIIRKFNIFITNEALIQYRIHGNNSSYLTKSNNSLFFKFKYRLILLLQSLRLIISKTDY